MSLYDELPQIDKETMLEWVKRYATYPCNSGRQLFDYWADAKERLYEGPFGKQFILKHPFSYEISRDELMENMEKDFNQWAIDGIGSYYRYLETHFSPEEKAWRDSGNYLYRRLRRLLNDLDDLCDNTYSGETFIVPAEKTVDGKPFRVTQGSKLMKMMGKLFHSFGLDEDEYEEMREHHSMVLNQKTFHGHLCLSIHPMDYMTMSDNEYNWSSCMRWRDGGESGEVGEYRLGTVEMMNSHYVVVAYLEGDKELEVPNGYSWNSKKWRMLMVVRPELILCNKQYPYKDDTLCEAACDWMRELCVTSGFGTYEEEPRQIGNGSFCLDEGHHISMNFRTNYMYNDISNMPRRAYIDYDYFKQLSHKSYYINLSGKATCMCCGAEILPNDGMEPSSLLCYACGDYVRCVKCGQWIVEHDARYDEAGEEVYCWDCYDNLADVCCCCSSWQLSKDMVEHPVACRGEIVSYKSIFSCQWCADNRMDKMEKEYGPRRYDEEEEVFVFDYENF